MKRCSKCGDTDETHFAPTHTSKCRRCHAEYMKEYYARTREAWCARIRERRIRDGERIRKAERDYKERHPEIYNSPEYNKKYYMENQGKWLKANAKRYFVRSGVPAEAIPIELVDLKAKQIALVRAIRKQRKAEA